MINANRYRHTGRTYVNIFRAGLSRHPGTPGLTPGATNLSPLRGFALKGCGSHRGRWPCISDLLSSERRLVTA